MIGVNTMIYSPSGGSVGIGFAIPIDTARRIVPELITYGMVSGDGSTSFRCSWSGTSCSTRGFRWIRDPRVQSDPGGNADAAGMRGGDQSSPVKYGRSVIYLGGDIIVEVDGTSIGSLADLFSALEDNKPGQEVDVVVLRGKQRRTLRIKLSERPKISIWNNGCRN
jgi:S1-C subfamily serine protease